MKVHELIKSLTSVPNQEAEVKLIANNKLCKIEDVWTNSQLVIIDGDGKND